jgi:hypothetical protein
LVFAVAVAVAITVAVAVAVFLVFPFQGAPEEPASRRTSTNLTRASTNVKGTVSTVP